MTVIPSIKLEDRHAMPQMGLGTAPMTDDEAERAVSAALELGYRHIDTAAVYDNEHGVGRAVNSVGVAREDCFITTKLGNDHHSSGQAREALEQSLAKLSLDYVDLYLIHWPLPKLGRFVSAWEQLLDLRDAGLARSIGVANFLPEHLDLLQDETGMKPAVNQFELHPTFQPEELINYCQEAGIAIVAYAPLGNATDLTHPAIVQIAEDAHATPAQVIVRWQLARGFAPIPKSKSPERIASNLAALDIRLSAAQLETIDGLHANNRQWGDPGEVNSV